MKNTFYLSLLLLAAFVSLSDTAKAQTAGATATSTSCEYISDYIMPGQANNVEDVYKLQAYLHIEEGIDVSFNGIFDAATQNGVRIMQERHRADILAPWGVSAATGNVYITTKHFLDEWSCGRELPFTAEETAILNSPRTSTSIIGRGTSGTGGSVAVNTPAITAPTIAVTPVTTVTPTATPTRTVSTGTNTGAISDIFGDNGTGTEATSTATTTGGWLQSARGSTILIIIVLAAIIYFIISMLSRTKTVPNTPAQNPNQNRNQNQNKGDRR
jgi:hypothetical protein